MEMCIYCQSNPAETKDHVPPKAIFREPRPSNLISVPACHACNCGFSSEDEYFLNLALDWDASESSDGRSVVQKRIRSMKRKEGHNFWKPVFATFRAVEVTSIGGIYLANSLEFSLNTERLTRNINRMIRGLYFEFTGIPLPVGDYVRSVLFSQYIEQHKQNPEAIEFVEHIPKLQGRSIGDGTFEVRYEVLDPDCHSSFWYLEFYRRFAFVGFTGTDDTLLEDRQMESTS